MRKPGTLWKIQFQKIKFGIIQFGDGGDPLVMVATSLVMVATSLVMVATSLVMVATSLYFVVKTQDMQWCIWSKPFVVPICCNKISKLKFENWPPWRWWRPPWWSWKNRWTNRWKNWWENRWEKKCDGPTYLPTYGHLTWIGARDAKKGVICQNVCWFAPKIYTNQQKFWQVAL